MTRPMQASLIELGQQIRRWREQTHAELAEVRPKHGRRRRYMTQEELAELCDVSVTLIQRLEAGRYPHLTLDLLMKLVDGLSLSADRTRYLLHHLPSATDGSELTRLASYRAMETIQRLTPNPALVMNQVFDVIYWNKPAEGFLVPFGDIPVEERNSLIIMLEHPDMKQRWVQWESYVLSLISGFKMSRVQFPCLRQDFDRLIQRLQSSDTFRDVWEHAEPSTDPPFTKRYLHPTYGSLTVNQTVQLLIGDEPQVLTFFQARDERTAKAFERMSYPNFQHQIPEAQPVLEENEPQGR